MKRILSILALLFFWSLENAFAQKGKKEIDIPTYDQIRGNRKEIYDYVTPGVHAAENKPTQKLMSRHYNAFNYPADSTIYYLNGRKVKNKKAAEAEVKEKAGNIERVMIGEVDEKGMRIIEINYETKKD